MTADAPLVKALLDQGANSGATTNTEDGITALMLAASGSTSRPRPMREPGFPANVSAPDWRRDDRPVMELLVTHGAKLDAQDKLGRTALWWSAVYAKKLANTRFLLDHHANVTPLDHFGSSPFLDLSVREGDGIYPLLAALIAGGADANAKYEDGTPVLVRAVTGPSLQFATLLLGAGADVNASDKKGWIALMAAVRAEQIPMTRLLLRAGAKVETEDSERNTALILAASRRPEAAEPLVRLLLDAGASATGSSGDYALEYAAVNGYVGAMRLLLAAGANPNALTRYNNPTNDQTVLMHTSQYPRVEPVSLLLAAGARINATQRNGDTTLLWAAGSPNNAAVVKLLLARGANPNAQDSLGHTALMKTVGSISEPNWPASAYVDTVRALLAGGADVGVKDHNGVTALMLAQRYPDVVAILLKAGREEYLSGD